MGSGFSFAFSSPFSDSVFSFAPSRAFLLGATTSDLIGSDRLIDPMTNDYIRTENGEWVETADSRTIVLIALSVHLGRSPFDPDHGTVIHELMKSGDLVDPETLQSETIRVGDALASEGVLSHLLVAVRDADGNPLRGDNDQSIVRTEWRDLASGSPIQQAFTLR